MVANLWIIQIMARTMASYVPFGMEPGLCTKQGNLYSMHVANLTYWAAQMMDSSSTGISGLLSGNRYDYGSFDQCVNISVPEYNIYGRYFVVNLKFNLKNGQFDDEKLEKIYRKPNPKSSVWEEFKPTKDVRINPTNEINWAVCVPASCTSNDVKYSLMAKLMPALESNGLIGNLTILDRYTYSKIDPPIQLPAGYHLFLFFAVGMITAVFLVTLYDVWYGDCITLDRRKWYFKFSIVKNMETLIKPEQTEFRAISGIKVLFMFVVIMAHRFMISMFLPMVNLRENELLTGNFFHTYLQNTAIIVDTFFVITGFLTYYKILKDIDKHRPVNVYKLVVRRWIRLVPVYAFMMCFVVYIAPQLESGPIGRGVIWQSACQQYWWTHLLFISNYVYPSKLCLLPSWYIASDLQLYALCSILGYILYKSRKVGLLLLGIVSILLIIIPGTVVYQGHYYSIYMVYHGRNLDYYLNDEGFLKTYFQAHLRAAPYVIGMASAYVYYLIKKKGIKLTNFHAWLVVVPAVTLLNATILAAWVFYIPGRDYILWEHVLYSIGHRIGWAVPIAIIISFEAITGFAPVRNTVGLRIFQCLNGLTYSALLVHSPLQYYLIGMGRSPIYYTRIMALWMSLGDIFMSYLIALALYLFVEAPLIVLQDLPSIFSETFKRYYCKHKTNHLKE